MRPGGYWVSLAIDPTDDTRAIKRAYAAQLKQVDMDADPAAYIALREARDAALAAVEAGLIDVGGDTESDGFGHGEVAAPVPFDPSIFETMAPIVVTSGFGATVLLSVDTAASSDNSVPTVPAPAPSGDEFSLECESVVQPAGETGTPTPLAARMMLIAPAVDPAGRVSGDIIIAPRAQGTNYQAHYDALIAMLRLNEEQYPPADFAEQSAMQRHFSVLLADPRMREIGFFAEAERWFANVIARTSPRSDALLEIAATHFAWSVDADTVDQSPEVAWNIARRKTLRFRTEVSQRGHPQFPIWRELTTAADENSRRGLGLKRAQVRQFLAMIRRDHPVLESDFDWYRVALWEREMPKTVQYGGAGIVIYLMLMVFSHVQDWAPKPAPSQSRDRSAPIVIVNPPLTDPDSDIAFALESNFGKALILAEVKARNPALYNRMWHSWSNARYNGDRRDDFTVDLGKMLLDRIPGDIGMASYPVLADFRRMTLERLKAVRAMGPGICDNYLAGTFRVPTTDAMRAKDREIRARLLLEADNGAPMFNSPEPRQFKIPGTVVDAAAKRARQKHETFIKALNDGATAKDRCDARIALLETALDLPQKDSLKLLREM